MLKNTDFNTIKWIFTKSKKQHLRLIFLSVCNVIFAVCSVVFALLCRGVVDGATAHDRKMFIGYAAGLLALMLLQIVLSLICSSVREVITARLEMDMRNLLFSSLLKKDFSKVSDYHSGELLNRMFSDIRIIVDGVTGIVPSFLNMVTKLVCAIAVLISLDTGFTLIFIIAGMSMLLITKFFRKKMKALHKDVQEKEGLVRSFLQEATESLLVMKAFGCEEKLKGINCENQSIHYKARMKRRTVSILAHTGFSVVFNAGYLYALVWGASGIYLGTMTYGTLTAILQLVNQIQTPFANLSSVFPRFYGMVASAERIIEIESLQDEEYTDKKLDYESFSSIDVSGLDFSYGDNHVLKNVNISISKGDFVSLTGISGGGKSTLFLLMLGAYHQQSGTLEFNSSSGTYLPGTQTRHLFAYVPQGNFLFSGTVAENIGFLVENPDSESIERAAEIACAKEFIESLPDGYETRIGENGFGVSQGQAQRIAIARAILSGAPILLFDEATSALDEATEEKLLKNISALENKTLLIVTHRPKALGICNKHLILKDGEITYAAD